MHETAFSELPGWVTALPEPYQDGIYTDVEIHLDWRGRLRMLITGTVYVNVRTLVEHSPGLMETETRVSVPEWRLPWAKRLELGVVEREERDEG